MHFRKLQIDNIYWFDCDFCPSMMFKLNFVVLSYTQSPFGFPLHQCLHRAGRLCKQINLYSLHKYSAWTR